MNEKNRRRESRRWAAIRRQNSRRLGSPPTPPSTTTTTTTTRSIKSDAAAPRRRRRRRASPVGADGINFDSIRLARAVRSAFQSTPPEPTPLGEKLVRFGLAGSACHGRSLLALVAGLE